MTSITLITEQSERRPGIDGQIGLLCETAPDGTLAALYPGALTVAELIGDFDETKQRAADLAAKLLADEPMLRGVQQLRVFEELVIRDLQHIFHVIKLHETVSALGINSCQFSGPSRYAAILSSLVAQTGSGITVAAFAEDHRIVQSLKRSWLRLRSSGLSWKGVRRELRLGLERVDPFHTLPLWRNAQGNWLSGETWFYTTAFTFTMIGIAYEPHFPTPFRYVVENSATGGAPLKERGRSYASLYQFGSTEFIPNAKESAAAKSAILGHLAHVPLHGQDRVARDLFVEGDFLAGFFDRMLPQGLYSTSLFENWAIRTRPAALIVGNPVFEAFALHAARKRSIPTVLLQHGTLGDFCQFIDPPIDHYIVRGQFWRQFLSRPAAAKAKILSPTQTAVTPLCSSADRRAILFLTAPYSMHELWPSSDLTDILMALLQATFDEKTELIVRVHPLETQRTYETKLQELNLKLPTRANISFSQGENLDSVLERSAVAVTFASTAFLDCLRHRVPIVSFGWHAFSYRRQIEKHGVFLFAESLAKLRQIVHHAVCGDVSPFSGDFGLFIDDTQDDELQRGLSCCVKPRTMYAGELHA